MTQIKVPETGTCPSTFAVVGAVRVSSVLIWSAVIVGIVAAMVAVEVPARGAVLGTLLLVVLFCVVDVVHPAMSTAVSNIAPTIIAKKGRLRFFASY
jgi:hypothetical protein